MVELIEASMLGICCEALPLGVAKCSILETWDGPSPLSAPEGSLAGVFCEVSPLAGAEGSAVENWSEASLSEIAEGTMVVNDGQEQQWSSQCHNEWLQRTLEIIIRPLSIEKSSRSNGEVTAAGFGA